MADGLSTITAPTIEESSGIPEIGSSELRKIAQDVLHAAKYTLAAVAANPAYQVQPNSLEASFREALTRLDAAKRAGIQARAQAVVEAPEHVRTATFGRYGKYQSTDLLNMGFARAHEMLPPLALDHQQLRSQMSTGVVLNRALPLPPQAGAVTDRLGFYITQVKCVDETDPNDGSDEIAIGGVTASWTGDTRKIDQTFVGDGFDTGDAKNYSPHWQFTSFNLSEGHHLLGSQWPKSYFVTLLMSEIDDGGLARALQEAWGIVGKKVKDKVEEVVFNGTVDIVGPEIAGVLGQIASWFVNDVVNSIIIWFDDPDDLFPPYVAALSVPGFNFTFPGGSKTGPLQIAHFKAGGYYYTVQYYWKLYADSPVVYEDNDYGGRSQGLDVGRYDVSQLRFGNDTISAVKVPPGWKVTLYQEAGFWGNTKVLTANTPALLDFNNGTSSIVVERMPVVYEDIDYDGRSQVLDVGRYDMGQLRFGHERITAVMVPSGWKVTLYENAGFQGRTKVLTADTPALLDFNDRTSSIVVERMAVVYEHKDYAGRSQVLDVGRYDMGQLRFGHERITAVMVPSGWKVTLYENAGFQGRTKVLTADTPALLDFNDRTSSIVVERM